MEIKPYLTFSLHGLLYGVDALIVQEIFYLPELNPVVEAPDEIIGLLNLRGKLLPVMHLALRLGQPLPECNLSDSVVVLSWEGIEIGIIVNSVHEVKNISREVVENEISYRREREFNSRFVAGIAKVDAGIIMLLDPEKIFFDSEVAETLPLAETNEQVEEYTNVQLLNNKSEKVNIVSSFCARCCPNITPEEKAIFRERADNLRQFENSSDFQGLMSLAVIGLNGEYFGLDLEVVREFTNLLNVTPIPCCPSHIVGNMNLRGEIVTLFDIRSALKIPSVTSMAKKAIVIQVDQVVAGLSVDEVFDVMYLNPSDVKPVPAAINSGSYEFLRGTAPYSEKMLSILDLPKIIVQGGLAVNEEI